MSKVIRVTQGVGSNPKLWGTLREGRYERQVMELDLPTATTGVTGILWGPRALVGGCMEWASPYGALGLTARKPYPSVDAVVAEMAALWPDAAIVRADGEPYR